MAHICQLIRQIDVPTPIVMLEVKILSIDLNDDYRSIFDYQFADDSLAAGGFTSGNILPPLANAGAPNPTRANGIDVQTSGAQALGFPLQPTDFIFQLVNANFRFRFQMLERQGRITEVATPMILTANNEVSQLFIGQQVPITVGFNSGSNNLGNQGAIANTVVVQQALPTTNIVPVGTTLLITPNINCDRTVTLRVTKQISDVIENGARIPLPNPNGGFSEVPVDTVRQRTFTGTIVAKDGLSVAIGGLIEERLQDNREEPPVLGKIPYLGFLFRRSITVRTRREQVIVIRPYIFFTPVESAMLSRDLMQKLSIHPQSPSAEGTLNSFLPREVLRPDPPQNQCQDLFKIFRIVPKDF